MSFKSKGPKSQPSQSPKANPPPPKPTPEKDSKSTNQKSTQKPNQKINQNSKLYPGKNQPRKNQRPKTNSSEEIKNNINPSQLDLNKDVKNIITNLTSQPFKEHSTPPTKSPLEPNKEAKNRITRPVFTPNMIQNGKNKITRINFKPNQNKGSKNIISRLIFDLNKPTSNKNKIDRPKLALNDGAKNKIIRHKLELNSKPKNRITRYKINPDNKEKSNNKIRRNSFKPNIETKSQIINTETKRPMVKVDRELKININGKSKKNPKNSPKLDGSNYSYKNLSDREIQNAFKKYYDEIGKFPNYGRNLRKDFIDWVKKSEKNPEIINKIKDIQNNQEISNFLVDKIQNSSNSQGKMIKSIENIGLHVSHGTIKNLALKEIFNNNLEQYKDRFQSSKYKGISPAIRNSIKSRLIEEVKKVNPTSLDALSKEFQVSRTTVNKIATENINPDLFKKTWPFALTVISPKLKDDILKLLEKEIEKEKPRSLKKISDQFNVSDRYLQDLAKERYPEQYSIKWPATPKIPIEIKQEIIKTIREESQKENPRTLKEIHKSLSGVSYDAIKQLAKKVVPDEIHDKIWAPICRRVPKEIRIQLENCLKKEILRVKPRSFNKIARKYEVSREYVRNIAKNLIPQSIYSNIWKPSLKKLTEDNKKEIINYIQNTNLNLVEIGKICGVYKRTVSSISQNSVFYDNLNAHRIRFPKDIHCGIGTYTHKNINSLVTIVMNNISNSKYYSEPKIFPDRRSSDGIIPNYNNFLEQRLNDPKVGENLVKSLGVLSKDNNIKGIQFDFSNDISDENVVNKIEKYQSPGTMLFIVGTKWDYFEEVKKLPNNSIIKYPENIKIISHNLFADFIGILGEEREIFDRIIELNNNKELDALRTLFYNDLSYVDTYNAKDLKNELIQRKLIKNSFDEYFHFTNLKSEERIEKQLDLDSFLNF